MSVDERLGRAASALRERVEPQPPPIVDVRRRRSTRRRAGALATFVVAAGAAILATGLFNGGGPSRSVIVRPAQSSPSATTVPPTISPAATSPSGLFLVGTPPKTPPAGWRVVDYHGFRQFLPPAWTVVERGCPGAAHTLTLGAPPRSRRCPAPDRGTAWIWLEPDALISRADARRCGPGYLDDIPGCGFIAKPPTETWLIDGLDVALVDAGHRVGPGDWQTIESSWQYTDPTRPEAGGPGTYGLSQPGYTAYAYVQARLAGNCAAQAAVVDRTYTGGCAAAQPGARAGDVNAISAGGAVSTTSYRVKVTPSSIAYDVKLQHEWSFAKRLGEWKVAGVTTVAADAPLPDPNANLPDCVPVAAPSGKTPGCAKKAELFPSRSATARPTIPDQVPVYASPKSTRIVGYMVQGAGYVRKNLAKRIPELRQCFTALQGSAPLTPSCRALLLQDGYDRHILARHP